MSEPLSPVARARYGSAVSSPSPRRGRPARVSTDDIVAAAVALIDEIGLEALTMRALAASMGIGPMTLYRHVADKQALLALIPDALLVDVSTAACRKRVALSALTTIAEGLAAVLQAHSGSVKLFEQPSQGPNMGAAARHVIGLLVAEGMTPDEARVALRAVIAQVIGEVLTMHRAVDLQGVDLLLDGVRARLDGTRASESKRSEP